MTRRCTLLLVALLSVLSSRVANSHHALSPVYDESRTVTISGVVTEFKLVNPHAMITLDVIDAAGDHVTWTVEMVGLARLARLGWTKDTVPVGERVTVGGFPSHTGSPKIALTRLVSADGTEHIRPGRVDLSAIEEDRRERARQRDQQK